MLQEQYKKYNEAIIKLAEQNNTEDIKLQLVIVRRINSKIDYILNKPKNEIIK